jgi:predicted outer membrane repeat protein
MLVDSLFMSNTARGGGGLLTNGALVLTNTQFLSNTADVGGGARFDSPAALNGGLFQNNAGVNDRGGGVYALNTLALTGTQFISNTAASVGGGVYAEGAVTANGALFERSQGVVGGGLYALSTLALTDTQFLSNTATSGGGGVFVFDSATLSGGLFADNASTNGGGGGISAGTLVLTDTQFTGNSAAQGGGVGASIVTLTGGLFEDNESTGAGGGLAAVTVTLTDTQFISNTAVGNGGGGHVNDATLSGGLFQANNSANGAGGGLYTFNTLALTDTAFISNTAGNGGGGAAASGAATVSGGLFAGNQCAAAFCFGGGLYASSATLTGTQFLSNTAADLGGGLFANDMVLTNTQFYSNAAAAAGGGAVSFGTASLQGGVFANNQCTDSSCQGGGLFVSSVLTATGTRFVGNRSAFNGGAIYLLANIPAESRLVNVLLARNSAGNTAAAIYKGFNSADIIHTTIVSSTVGAGAAIFAGGGVTNITNTIISSYATGIERASGTVNEDYNLFFNVPVTTTGGVTSGGNSLSGDPAFLNPGADDYHVGFGSAALDAGVDVGVATDFEDDARPLGRGFDIGYDEGAPITGLSAANSGPSTLGSATAFTATATGPNIMYQWNFGDGDTGSGATASHTYMLVGNYTAIVTAMNEVSVVTATTPVTITDVPISGLSAANSSPTPFGQTTLFTATVSAGSNVTYQWNFGDGDAGSGATASHTYAAVGNYIATVTTTNGVSILTATTPVTITQIRIYLPVVLNSAPASGALPDRFSSAARSEGAPRSASRLHAERVAWRPEASPVRIKGFRN